MTLRIANASNVKPTPLLPVLRNFYPNRGSNSASQRRVLFLQLCPIIPSTMETLRKFAASATFRGNTALGHKSDRARRAKAGGPPRDFQLDKSDTRNYERSTPVASSVLDSKDGLPSVAIRMEGGRNCLGSTRNKRAGARNGQPPLRLFYSRAIDARLFFTERAGFFANNRLVFPPAFSLNLYLEIDFTAPSVSFSLFPSACIGLCTRCC